MIFFNKLIINKYTNYRYIIKYSITNKTFIKNKDLPLCKNCVYCIKPSIFDFDTSLYFSKCKLFGSKNLINGEIIYNFTSTCRDNEIYCGINGKYYKN